MADRAILRRSIRVARICAANLFARLVAAALPNRCALCGNLSHQTICAWCDDAYWNEARLRCPRCALPLAGKRMRHDMQTWRAAHALPAASSPHGTGTSARAQPLQAALARPPTNAPEKARPPHAARYYCSACANAPPGFDATLALADYRAPLDGLALELKFRAHLALGREFGARLARLASDALDDAPPLDAIAPVPLGARRLVERGYNQAWEIARPLAQALCVRANPTLVARVTDTAPQSRLAYDARRMNVAAAFAIARPVTGLHIGIVDDVMTSGATLDAIARALKDAGARRVTNFVALRTAKD
ncbi:Competence protein F homolog, phosphoribosyltransferase domain; protein YhgH required for utilization of DNA as sole source of carbon and energy [Burkholderia singularis]|uniref:Competence protein F homolog, phosphoribosyltransferase domain protein YhgH required for utilization of DNA as sole source of carbon and energy n=1 Tax=Burkholderia singularis TaxID=1503053 RepID=A0A238H9H0_9BURK|nr:double zinc ribbon domain-containing protein [Burkholderia singularis]SMG01868.1 Competence protein F homolog, phosphoribosyltransferase domain; protein YhgH required for utilization of DNA as sole source of carbon and energy [Burkholderia singularis]